MTFSELLRAKSASGVVALFYGANCAPCKALKPKLRTACEDLNLQLHEFDIKDEMEIVKSLGIRAVPTVVAIQQGKARILFSGGVHDPKGYLLTASIVGQG